MRPSLRASELIEFHARDAYSNLLKCSVASEVCAMRKRRKSQSELPPTVPQPDRKLYLPCWWRWSFVFMGNPPPLPIPWRIPCVWQKMQQVWNQNHTSCFSTKGRNSVFLRLVSCSLKCTPLEHYLYLIGVTSCHKRIFISRRILTSSAKRGQFGLLTALHNYFIEKKKKKWSQKWSLWHTG